MVNRDMNRYETGQIYKIVSPDFKKCYIGSTCEGLKQRMAHHHQSYKLYLKGKGHKITSYELFDEFGFENCKIIWIEDYPCNSKKELEAREGYYQQHTECVNRVNLGRTPKEYKEYYNRLNQDKIKQGLKEWYERTKEERRDKYQEYRDNHKPEMKEYNKEYRENNKHKLKQNKKEYYEREKTIILAKEQLKFVICEICNCKIRGNKSKLTRHNKTQKHISNLNNNSLKNDLRE